MDFDPLKKAALLFVFIAGSFGVAENLVDFTVVERIKFSVPGDWPVIASKSTSEKTIFGFQIPNAVDKNTPTSSNLSIVSSYLKDDQDRDAFEKKAAEKERNAQERKLVEGWRCTSFFCNASVNRVRCLGLPSHCCELRRLSAHSMATSAQESPRLR